LSLLHSVRTDSGAQPAFYPKGAEGNIPWGKATGRVKLTTHLYLVPKSRKVELYLHSPICLHGIALN
jgi:hypothetical protein